MILFPQNWDMDLVIQNPDQMLLGISKLQGEDQDSFDAKNQDHADPTERMDPAWIQGGCRDT